MPSRRVNYALIFFIDSHFPPQMNIFFNISNEDFSLYFFLHNKDQMYFPKINGVFGSDFTYLKLDRSRLKDRNTTGFYTFYTMKQTQWKELDTPRKRCKVGSAVANTTRCITQYLEDKVGCSMGIARSDPQLRRKDRQ